MLVILLDYWSVWLGGAYDETHYLSDDGDHPNAAGHEKIATAADVITAAVHP